MQDTKKEKGVVYISADDSYLEEAIRSVKSLKKHNPEINSTLYTDEENLECEAFDQINTLEYKIDSMDDSMLRHFMTPYKKNLYLDTDTYITGDISEVFEILDNYEIAACHAPGRKRVIGTPECFREYNTGVIAYRGSEKVKKIFRKWKENYEAIKNSDLEIGKEHDQHPFAKSIFESDIDFVTLPPEYNMRLPRCGYASMEVKIIHGRPRTSMKKVEKTLNRSKDSRVHFATQSIFGSGRKTMVYTKSYMIEQGIRILKKEGIKKLLDKIKN